MSAPERDDVAAARAGDEDAFGRLWRTLNPALLRYLRVVVPSAGDDLAAETWLRVVRHLRRFTGDEAAFRAWVFSIARNLVIDWRRRESRHPTGPLDDAARGLADAAAARRADGIGGPADATGSAEGEALQRLDTGAALRLIATLPPEQAEIIALRVVAGLDVGQVAKLVRKSPGAVRVGMHRGLRRLRAVVDGAGVGSTAEPMAAASERTEV